MPSRFTRSLIAATLCTLCLAETGFIGYANAQTKPAPEKPASIWPGRRPDGSVLLPNMWSLRPAGTQVDVADFPVNIAVHPDGKHAVILHAGNSGHELHLLDIPQAVITQRIKIDEAFYGLEFSSNGKRIYASGGANEVIRWFEFDKSTGMIAGEKQFKLRDAKERGIPAGLTLTSDAKTLYVANVLGQKLAKLDLASESNPVLDIELGDFAVQTPPSSIGAIGGPTQSLDEAAITKRAEAALDPASPEAPYPYACRLDERKGLLYVSLWARGEVAVIDLESNRIKARWKTEEHPNEMLLTKNCRFLYVANGNRNTISVINTEEGTTVETIWSALHPQAPPGSTPNSLALSPDEKTLFVANANVNNVAVIDVSTPGKSRSMGFIPTGWYPTSVRVTPDGKTLLVANGKGIISKPNPNGPQPVAGRTTTEYIGSLF